MTNLLRLHKWSLGVSIVQFITKVNSQVLSRPSPRADLLLLAMADLLALLRVHVLVPAGPRRRRPASRRQASEHVRVPFCAAPLCYLLVAAIAQVQRIRRGDDNGRGDGRSNGEQHARKIVGHRQNFVAVDSEDSGGARVRGRSRGSGFGDEKGKGAWGPGAEAKAPRHVARVFLFVL